MSCRLLQQQEATKNMDGAIRRVLAGELYLSSVLAQRLAGRVAGQAAAKASTAGSNPWQIANCKCWNSSAADSIPARSPEGIGVDASTIDTYRARIKEKLNVHAAGELLQHAIAGVHSTATA